MAIGRQRNHAFDFWLNVDGNRRKIKAKSTSGDFNLIIHISMAELLDMRDSSEPYDLYRLYALDENRACLRVAEILKEFALDIVARIAYRRHGGWSVGGAHISASLARFDRAA